MAYLAEQKDHFFIATMTKGEGYYETQFPLLRKYEIVAYRIKLPGHSSPPR